MPRWLWTIAVVGVLSGTADAEEPAKVAAPGPYSRLADYARTNPSCMSFTDDCQTCVRGVALRSALARETIGTKRSTVARLVSVMDATGPASSARASSRLEANATTLSKATRGFAGSSSAH
jgi:hypothetical protein